MAKPAKSLPASRPSVSASPRASARPLAVVVASGGMDSSVCISIAAQTYEPALFHLNYGQRTERRELKAFRDLARHFRVKHTLIVDAGHFAQIGGSALTDPRLAVPDADEVGRGIPITYVPFRNANILAMAVSWAEVIGARRVFIGAVEEDSSGYPDCRESFLKAFNRAVQTGTAAGRALAIEAPLLHLSKKEIVRLGASLQTPFELTWSCYQGEKVACGTCDSCRLRLKGFRQARLTDPIPYHPS
ncbi:MAG: 7-cyano-7-deazaguanine synthase QueC [Candidatus Riflebacteria bacterium]|nr:7-cyano-7-deazaguanine synthase QueC [Candidatus Riflebacteria bacterium]